MKPLLRVGIAGLGTVGAGVVRLLAENAEIIAARAGRVIAVTAVSARDRSRDRGIRLEHLRWYDDAAALAASLRAWSAMSQTDETRPAPSSRSRAFSA